MDRGEYTMQVVHDTKSDLGLVVAKRTVHITAK